VLQRSLTTETACARACAWGEGTFAGPRMTLLPNGSLNGSPNGFPNGFPNGSLQVGEVKRRARMVGDAALEAACVDFERRNPS
jgi:hypothetical protein